MKLDIRTSSIRYDICAFDLQNCFWLYFLFSDFLVNKSWILIVSIKINHILEDQEASMVVGCTTTKVMTKLSNNSSSLHSKMMINMAIEVVLEDIEIVIEKGVGTETVIVIAEKGVVVETEIVVVGKCPLGAVTVSLGDWYSSFSLWFQVCVIMVMQ